MTCQGMVEASIREGADASLLAQQLDGRLASVDSLRTAARVRLACILYVDEALRDLGTFDFVASHLFSAAGRHASAVAELLRLIKRLDDLHTEVQGMITSPYLATTLLYNVLCWWSLYLNRCVTASSSEDVRAARATVPFSLEPILLKFEGGRYVGPLLQLPLTELVSGICDSDGGDTGGGDSGSNGKGGKEEGRDGDSGGGSGSSRGGDGRKSGGAVWGGAVGGGAGSTTVPFSLDPILLKLEGGHYVGPLLPLPLADLVSGRRDSDSDGTGVSGSGSNSKGGKGEVRGVSDSGGGSGGSRCGYGGKSGGVVCGGAGGGGGGVGSTAGMRLRYDAHLTALSLWDGKNSRTILEGTVLPTVQSPVL